MKKKIKNNMEYTLERAREYFTAPNANEERFNNFVADFIKRLRTDEFKNSHGIINGQMLPEKISDTLFQTSYYVIIDDTQDKIVVKEIIGTDLSIITSITLPEKLDNLFQTFLSTAGD